MKNILSLSVAMMLPMAASAVETIAVNETFESYANTAAMEAVWTPGTAGAAPLTINAGQGASGSNNYVTLPLTAVPTLVRTAIFGAGPVLVVPSDANPINLTVFLKCTAWAGTRQNASVRDAGLATSILAIGSYNAPTHNSATGSGAKWTARVAGWTGGPNTNAAYYSLLGGPDRVNSVWTKLEAHGATTSVSFEIDDVLDSADTIVTTAAPGTGFSSARIGLGSSTTQDVLVDNYIVSTGTTGSDVSDWDLY